MFNKLEARVLSEYKRSRAAPSTFCTLIKHYFSFIKHYKISITMCDVSKGGGGGSGVSPEKRPYDVSHGQNRYVRLP